MPALWRISVDVGGTFTDGVASAPDGTVHRCKVMSAADARGDSLPAPIAAARQLIGLTTGAPLPPIALRVGTTRGTNAILEGTTGRVLMVLPEGLGDILEIGDQRRPDLFAWHPIRPRPPLHAIVTTRARRSADGTTRTPLDRGEMQRVCDAVRAAVASEEINAIGVALLHADVEPNDEAQLAAALREATGLSVTASHQMGRVAGFLDRARAVHADALLVAPMRAFVASIQSHLARGSTLHFMTSAAGLADADSFFPKDSVLSGPAGGARGALQTVRGCQLGPSLAFDMGGTSTDITRLDDRVPFVFTASVAGLSVATPCVDVESIAAGAGSIVRCVSGALRIGPESAGSSPGPACFGRGGPLTITDLNLLAGRLDGTPLTLDRDAARVAMERVRAEFCSARGAVDAPTFIDACLALADEMMARAIRRHAIARGRAPASHTLVAFGGAGPLHACAVAEALGIGRIHVPTDAGLLSAVGIASSAEERLSQRTVRCPLVDCGRWIPLLRELERECAPDDSWRVDRTFVLTRLQGQESSLTLEHAGRLPPEGAHSWATDEFQHEYGRVYGSAPPAGRAVEVESLRVLGCTGNDARDASSRAARTRSRVAHGPATINRMDCTVWVRPRWTAHEYSDGSIDLEASDGRPATALDDVVREEILAARLGGIAEEMGELLRRTAVSVNVKERLDFSCSVLDASGALVANAPHLPVHLGSMGLCVRTATRVLDPAAGEAIAVNHPAFGGSHLPDITVITPLDLKENETVRRVAYLASRAHHAELGGVTPGSMPPNARLLSEEAIIIPPTRVRREGHTNLGELAGILRGSAHPSRQPEENEQDLLAQVAANEAGLRALTALAGELGSAGLVDAFGILRTAARRRAAVAIASLPGDVLTAEERLDDGSSLRVHLRRNEGSLTVDFMGSAPIHPHSFNAPEAVVRSVVMYVLRLIAGRERPDEAHSMVLNEGFLDDVSIEGLGGLVGTRVADGAPWPAVGAGNTETSQRLTDLLLKACKVSACSQGTMNNLLFGNARFGFYETIGGGAGASAAGHGLSCVHTHMTNTRVTDPEILERRLPVVLERFERRRASGGAGAFHGGDGIIRRIRFLEPVEISLLTQHRLEAPYGATGGEPGACGRQRIHRRDGMIEELVGVAAVHAAAGDAIEIETPGGGGWGERRRERGDR